MKLTDEERKQFEEFCEHERTNGGQFPVKQIRPSLVGLMRLATEAENNCHNIRGFDVALLGFETCCLINYVVLLEERLDNLGQYRRRPTPAEMEEHHQQVMNGKSRTFAGKMWDFFRNIFSDSARRME